MNSNYFFIEEENPTWDLKGLDPWDRVQPVFDTELVDRLRLKPQDDIHDIDAAYGLAHLAHEELIAYGTGGGQRLNDDEMAVLLRSLRAVLKRLSVPFNPEFRNFKTFREYWGSHGMSGSWGARGEYLNVLFDPIFSRLDELEDLRSGSSSIRGVDGELRNLIFASTGPKPEIVLRDAINNVIKVTKNAEYCLFYNRPLADSGLIWGELVDWWKTTNHFDDKTSADIAHHLWGRLNQSLGNNSAEKLVFRTYCERYGDDQASKLPALLPQIYLHYDPLTRKQRGGRPSALMRERMDFLLLLPGHVRIVLEVDGKQHYAKGETASSQLYAEMVAEDRRLRLRGYEVYRFGGFELEQAGADTMLREFYKNLLEKYLG